MSSSNTALQEKKKQGSTLMKTRNFSSTDAKVEKHEQSVARSNLNDNCSKLNHPARGKKIRYLLNSS